MGVKNAVLQRLQDERASVNEQIDRVLDGANEEERDPSESERSLITRYRARLGEIEPMIVELVELEESRAEAREARASLTRSGGETTDAPPAEEPGEPEDYRTFAHYARDEIITRFSQVAQQVDPMTRQRAKDRLTRAVEQVLVANVAGITLPQYLSQIVGVIDANRPLVAASRRVGLSAGKIQYPVIGTRPTVEKQAAEKTEAGDGTMTVTLAEALADTYLTAANFSWQVIQWSNPDALALWFDLAAESYALKTDAAAGAALAGIDATPTAVGGPALEDWTAAIAGAAGEVYAASRRRANAIAASPTVAYGLMGLVSAQNPVFITAGGGNLTGSFGTVGGLSIIATPSLDDSTVIVGDFSQLLTGETPGAPVQLRAVEPSIGGLEVGIIGAFVAKVTDPLAFAELTPFVAGP